MANPNGNPMFSKGNQLAKGRGRPKKNDLIRQLEQLRKEINRFPDALLTTLANKEQTDLIPMNQIKAELQEFAAALISLRNNV